MDHGLALSPWFFCVLTVFAAGSDDDETVVVVQNKLGDRAAKEQKLL